MCRLAQSLNRTRSSALGRMHNHNAPMFSSVPLPEPDQALDYARGARLDSSPSVSSTSNDEAGTCSGSGNDGVLCPAARLFLDDPLCSPVSVLQAFKAFREDIDVLSLDSVSEEVLADADFLFDLSADADLAPLPASPARAPAAALPPVAFRSASEALAAASYQLSSPTTSAATPRSPFEDALDACAAPRVFSGFGAAAACAPLADLQALTGSCSGSRSLRFGSAESVGSPTGSPPPQPAAALPLRALLRRAASDDAASSLGFPASEYPLTPAALRSALSMVPGLLQQQQQQQQQQSLAASPAVAALERAACSLADNLQHCLARYACPPARLPMQDAASGQRGWGPSKVCNPAVLQRWQRPAGMRLKRAATASTRRF